MNAKDCLNKEEKTKRERIHDMNEMFRGSSTASIESLR